VVVVPPPQPQAAPQAASQPTPQPETPAGETPASTATTINPAILNQILPDIVPSALKTINGTLRVSVEITVGADGKVTDATLASPGPSKYFAAKSLEAARQWKFRPAQAGNWTLEFQYTRGGIHVVAEPAAP
jgi:protein TonB